LATVAFTFGFLSLNTQRKLKARWSRQLLDALGVRLRTAGTPPAAGLFVSNHISWLDIYAINALAPTAFVSKDDVRGWPVIGWFSKHTETIFIERGSRNAAMRTKEAVVEKLRCRTRVGVYPEGTTGDGDGVLPFHSALFQSSIDAGVAVVPVALRYTGRDGKPSQIAAYVGDTTLWQCLRAIVAASGLTVHVAFLPVLDPAGHDRRQLAHRAHTLIASRLARPGSDTAVETPDDLQDALPSGCLPTGSPSQAPGDSLPA
jgi:1-acyl-sn-glycerol-3-phosphate acyltransferase